MAKILITMEAEIDDLKSFYPNDPEGITIENVASTIHTALVCDAITKMVTTSIGEKGLIRDALLRNKTDDYELGKRLTEKWKIELIEDKNLRLKLSEVGRKTVEEKYSVNVNKEKYLKVFSSFYLQLIYTNN